MKIYQMTVFDSNASELDDTPVSWEKGELSDVSEVFKFTCSGVSYCRTSVQQGLQNVQHTKNLKHCLTVKFSQNMTN